MADIRQDYTEELRELTDYLGKKDLRLKGRVNTSYEGGVLTLTGRVGSHYLRQLAQEGAMRFNGFNNIENNLEVRLGEELNLGTE